MFLEIAENNAERNIVMYMEDYFKKLDMMLSSTGKKILIDIGCVSHNQAIGKAKSEEKESS